MFGLCEVIRIISLPAQKPARPDLVSLQSDRSGQGVTFGLCEGRVRVIVGLCEDHKNYRIRKPFPKKPFFASLFFPHHFFY